MIDHLVINEDQLIKDIAYSEDMNVATVRKVIKRMEYTIFDYLSFATPVENVTVKIIDGLSVESKHIPEKICKHPETQEEIIAPSRLRCKPKITRYFNRKLNSNNT